MPPSSADVENERNYTSAPSVCFHVTTRMNNSGNRALEIRILNPEFDLPVKILTRNYRSGKRCMKFKLIDLPCS
jgi:hypothetical protein